MTACEPEETVFRWLDETCEECGRQRNTWDRRCQIAIGSPVKRCQECMAKMFGKSVDDFQTLMSEYFDIRPCRGATKK